MYPFQVGDVVVPLQMILCCLIEPVAILVWIWFYFMVCIRVSKVLDNEEVEQI